MNEMKMLRDHRDAQPGPTPETVAHARARLTDQTRLTARARRPIPARRWRYALVAAGAAAAATAAVAGGNNTRPAYAAERLPNGTIKVTLREFTDSAGLQRRLDALGVHATVNYLPRDMHCAPGRATVDDRVNSQPEVVETPWAHVTRPRTADLIFYIHADRIRPGQTLVWEMTYDHDAQGQFRGMMLGTRAFLARGPVKPCKPIRW
jgi:hypothetical protein